MYSGLRWFVAGLAISLLGASALSAQTGAPPFDFNLLLTSNGNAERILNNTTINLSTQVNTQTSVTIKATYAGTTQATISNPIQLIGSTEFTAALVGAPAFPIILNPGDSVTFTVTYFPTTTASASAQLTLAYTEPGAGGASFPNAIVLQFQGVAPAFTLSYVLQSDNNVVQIAPGGTIPFHPTQVDATANATLNITDTGSGPGTITNVELVSGGPVFKLIGLPLFPYTLTSSNPNLPIGVTYTPTAVQNDTGQIKITYQGGTTALVNLTGSGATSSYAYTVLSNGTSTPVKPNSTITLPPVTVSTTGTTTATSSVILTVTNSGNASGTINSINVTGPFQLIGLPTTPPTLKPGDTESFTITYTPTQVGTQTGQLVVGSDIFTLSGTGLGPLLSFAYSSGGTTIPIPTNGSVVFPSIPVGQSEVVNVIVTNSGTSTTIIDLVSTTPNPPYSVAAIPATPLAAGQSTTIPVTFKPSVVGPVTGSLLVNSSSVALVGAGSAPASLPFYTLSGPSGDVAAATQVAISLNMSKSYPVDLTGVLTITTSGSFGTDPNVQFSSGGRTVDFSIPANSTSVDFAGQGSQILLQTGTVAESITLTPSFKTTGGVDVTPAPPTTLQFTVPSSAPVITSIQPSNETASSFVLLITGYSTTRSLTSVSVTFNPAVGFNVRTTTFTTDISQVATVWFSSDVSQAFGGLFEISIPFNLTGSVSTGRTLLQSIASVSATVSNSTGTSNSLQANLP